MDMAGGWIIGRELGVYKIPICIVNPETDVSVVKICLFDTEFSGYLGFD